MVQCGKRPALVFRFALKKLLPHLLYFLPPRSSSLHLNIFLLPNAAAQLILQRFCWEKSVFWSGECGPATEKKGVIINNSQEREAVFNRGRKKV